MRTTTLGGASFWAIAFALAGCGGGSPRDGRIGVDGSIGDGGDSDGMMAMGNTVEVLVGAGGKEFTPATVTIHRGDTVRWKFVADHHNVIGGTLSLGKGTPDHKFCSPFNKDCDFYSAVYIEPGNHWDHIFPDAGVFDYFCARHSPPGAAGEVVVE